MDIPAIEPRLASDRHDVVLALALGALAIAQRFEEAVERASASDVPPLDRDDPVVLASLGIVALAASVRRWLEEAEEPAPDVSSAVVDPPIAPGELLR